MNVNIQHDTSSDPLSVKDYIAILNAVLTSQGGRIIGETSEVKFLNGHAYFSLKDKSDEAILKCTIWRSAYARAGIELENGMEIIIEGVPNVWAPKGNFSFIVKTIALVGEGALKKQYDKLKAKLTAEGLFAPEHKRELPDYPKTIGVITSQAGGVVLYDYSNNLGKFGFISKIVDSRVEGPDAIKELIDSVRTLRKEEVDALVIIRGGGSLESFAAFNNESLVREIVNFPAPVIAGIGHHVDVCLVGLAADKMVSTPTAVAELLNESWERAINELKLHEQGLINKYSTRLSNVKFEIQNASSAIRDKFSLIFESFRSSERTLLNILSKFDLSLQRKTDALKVNLDSIFREFLKMIEDKKYFIQSCWSDKLKQRFTYSLHHLRTVLDYSEKSVRQHDPETQLKLGYSIISSERGVIKNISSLNIGDQVKLKLFDGEAVSEIKNII